VTKKLIKAAPDKQTPHSGKVANDHNKVGKEGKATQLNEGRRTATSRHDREDHIGNNQVKVRRGSTQGSSSHQPPMKSARGRTKPGM
jgi:hypothetical protein